MSPRTAWQAIRKAARTTWRVYSISSRENLNLMAAGVAFYALLALFPGLGAVVSLYGMVADPAHVAAELDPAADVMPDEAWALVEEQLREIGGSEAGALGLGFLFSLVLTLWSATRGMRSTIIALNVIHRVQETRNVIVMNLVAYALTVMAVLVAALAIGVIVGVPVLLRVAGLEGIAAWLAGLLPWPVLIAAVVFGASVVYRFGPAGHRAPSRRSMVAALGATVAWTVASAAFSLYVTTFGAFNVTYGSIGAVVVLLLWFLVSAFVFLLGAIWNALPVRDEQDGQGA